MPYEVRKDGNKWYVKKKLSGEVVSAHDSAEKANAAIRAIYANINEGSKSKGK